MNKKYEETKLKYLLKLPKNSTITLYRHPKEFSHFEIEKINPTHKLIIWGLLRKKYVNSKPTYKIKCGRVSIPCLLISYVYLNNFVISDYMINLMLDVILSSLCVYSIFYFPLVIKDVNRNTGRIRNRQNYNVSKIFITGLYKRLSYCLKF